MDRPFPQAAYRIYCDLRSYDDDQVRRVYDWFIRETAGAQLRTSNAWLESFIDSVNLCPLFSSSRTKYPKPSN